MIRILTQADISAVLDLFERSFKDDPYYTKMFPNNETRSQQMISEFAPGIEFMISSGFSTGIWHDDELVAFLLLIDYHDVETKHPQKFLDLFSGANRLICSTASEIPGDVMFIIDVAVDDNHRRKGLASKLIDVALKRFEFHSFIGDVSNELSLPIYSKRGFEVIPIEEHYNLVTLRR